MSAAALLTTLYWRNVTLSRDFRALVASGEIQRRAAAANDDTASGWWAAAAGAYLQNDDVGRIAKRACEVMAAGLASGVPS